MRHSLSLEVRGQFVEVGSLLPLFGLWELSSGCHDDFVPFLDESSHQSFILTNDPEFIGFASKKTRSQARYGSCAG